MATTLSPEDAAQLRTYERQRHDALAEGYIGFFAPVTALAIAPLLERCGCGPGMQPAGCAERLRERSPPKPRAAARMSSASISRSGMVADARKLHPGIDFHVGDVEHLPVADGTLDAVVCAFGIGHFPYPEASVAECLRTLKPGGRDRVLVVGCFRQAAHPRALPRRGRRGRCQAAAGLAGRPFEPAVHQRRRVPAPARRGRARRHHAARPPCHAPGAGRRRAVARRAERPRRSRPR